MRGTAVRRPAGAVADGLVRVRVEVFTLDSGLSRSPRPGVMDRVHMTTTRYLDGSALTVQHAGDWHDEDFWMGEPVPVLAPGQRARAAAVLLRQVRAAVNPSPMQVFVFIMGLRNLEDQGASEADVEAVREALDPLL